MASATYDPADNKLRFSPDSRLDAEDYARAKAAGFIWAPHQKIFICPRWTPTAEDLLLEWCGEIGDEDTSLVERAENRAERFEEYSEKRKEDAERAHAAVDAIADNIPLGQPILVGHHSEKHARKDAEKIENGMRKAINLWETSKYWEQRAASALHHAKYKERPDVRARRIKGIEADIRRLVAEYTPDPKQRPIMERAHNYATGKTDEEPTPHVWCGQSRGGHWVKVSSLEAIKKRNQRWIDHYNNRLLYERAMLQESGGLITDRVSNIELGGRVLVRGEWVVILKINKKDGKIISLSTNRSYVSTVGVEEVKDYQSPEEGATEKVKKAMSLPPMCNYPGEGFCKMTKVQYASVYTDSKGGHLIKASETTGAHRVRSVMAHIARNFDKDCTYAREHQWGQISVYLTDEKQKDPPTPTGEVRPKIAAPERVIERPTYTPTEPTKFDALKDTLKAGIKVVSASQLFPTPPEIAAKMVELAEIEPGNRILEPSAGTGNILRAIFDAQQDNTSNVRAVEINLNLVDILRAGFPSINTLGADFLSCNGNLGTFDRIIMNPPFTHSEDIKHIRHALTMLAPGGRLVALCANGPRQREAFIDEAETWEDLPANSFKAEGTGVNVAMLVINKPAEKKTFEGGLF